MNVAHSPGPIVTGIIARCPSASVAEAISSAGRIPGASPRAVSARAISVTFGRAPPGASFAAGSARRCSKSRFASGSGTSSITGACSDRRAVAVGLATTIRRRGTRPMVVRRSVVLRLSGAGVAAAHPAANSTASTTRRATIHGSISRPPRERLPKPAPGPDAGPTKVPARAASCESRRGNAPASAGVPAPVTARPPALLRREALRAAGAAVGAFVLLNLAGELLRPPFDTTGAWISLPDPPWLRHLLAALLAAALVAHAVLAERPPLLRRAGALLSGAVVLVALADAAGFYAALFRGRIRTPAVVPASLLVAAFFALIVADLLRPAPSAPPGARRDLVRAVAFVGVLLALPLVLMLTFGPTRYERRADCAVVFGARVWDDGTPSDALADRVDESIRLYRQGRVRKLVMSGGVEPENGLSEAEVMRARAEAAGVPRGDILLDEEGKDTASTVRNVARLLDREGLGSALVVSHYYHEPRAKMLFDRAGVRAFTVPATMTRRLYREPYFIAREVAAFWHSFLLE